MGITRVEIANAVNAKLVEINERQNRKNRDGWRMLTTGEIVDAVYPLTERLSASVAFTLTDPSRMLSKDDVVAVCPSIDLCFEYGDRVRCGPCGVKASAALGVEIDDKHSHLPEVCRLRRALRESEQREKEATAKALEHAAKVAEGNYDHIGVQTKHDRCPHGKFGWEDCDQCVAAAIRALKAEEN